MKQANLLDQRLSLRARIWLERTAAQQNVSAQDILSKIMETLLEYEDQGGDIPGLIERLESVPRQIAEQITPLLAQIHDLRQRIETTTEMIRLFTLQIQSSHLLDAEGNSRYPLTEEIRAFLYPSDSEPNGSAPLS